MYIEYFIILFFFQCLSTRRILNITHGSNANVPSQTKLHDLGRASVVLLNYILSFQTSCTLESIRHGYVGSCRLYDQCVSEMHGRLSPMKTESPGENLEALEGILREVKAVFEPDSSKQVRIDAVFIIKIFSLSRFDKLLQDMARHF